MTIHGSFRNRIFEIAPRCEDATTNPWNPKKSLRAGQKTVIWFARGESWRFAELRF
jgi:hypothetical protein